jgi:hypothetical protein
MRPTNAVAPKPAQAEAASVLLGRRQVAALFGARHFPHRARLPPRSATLRLGLSADMFAAGPGVFHMNPVDLAIGGEILGSIDRFIEADRFDEQDFLFDGAHVLILREIGHRAFRFVIDIPGIDDKRGQRWHEDIEIADFDIRPG